jgi:hypothetical protein
MSACLTALTYLPFHAGGSSFSPWLAELSEEYASSCDETRLLFPPGGVHSFNSALVEDLFRSAFTSFFWRLYSSSSNLWGNSSLARLKNSTGFSGSVTFATADLLKSERFFGTGGTSVLELWSAIVGLGWVAMQNSGGCYNNPVNVRLRWDATLSRSAGSALSSVIVKYLSFSELIQLSTRHKSRNLKETIAGRQSARTHHGERNDDSR